MTPDIRQRLAHLALTTSDPDVTDDLDALLAEEPEKRHTCLGVLPVNVNTIDLLDKEVTDTREANDRLRSELAEARRDAMQRASTAEEFKALSLMLRSIANRLDPEGAHPDEPR